MWELYGGVLRSDFSLFDTYEHEHGSGAASSGAESSSAVAAAAAAAAAAGSAGAVAGASGAPFDIPITTFYAADDRRVTRQHVEGWRRFSTSAEFSTSQVEGHHLFVYNPDQKAAW